MDGAIIRRALMSIAFLVALVCLVVNLARGADLYYAGFSALCVLFASALILFQTLRGAVSVVARFMRSQQSSTPETGRDMRKLSRTSELRK